MSTTTILFIVIVGVAIIVAFYLKSKGAHILDESAESELKKLSDEERALFELAMHPEKTPHTFIYALTTCAHCRKTRLLLEENSIPFTIIYIDSYPKALNKELSEKFKEYNPRGSFPTIRLTSGQIITGYRENSIKEALINDPERTSTES